MSTMRPRSSSIARSQKRSTEPMSCVTNTIVRPAAFSRVNSSKHFCWKDASPTASTSSINTMSASTWIATENASRIMHARGVVLELEVHELLELGERDDVRASARCASLRDSPSMIALMIALSRAVSSGLKPTPSSMNGESRPCTSSVPQSIW